MSREVASCFIIDDEDRFLIVRRSDTDWWRPYIGKSLVAR